MRSGKYMIIAVLLVACVLAADDAPPSDLIFGDYAEVNSPYYRVDVNASDLKDIVEYSYAIWFRFNYFDPKPVNMQTVRKQHTSIAGVSENGDWAWNKNAMGDKALTTDLINLNGVAQEDVPQLHFACYSVAHNDPSKNQIMDFDYKDHDSAWNFLYFGYSYTEKRAFAYFRGGRTNEIRTLSFDGYTHRAPPPGLMFSIGSPSTFLNPWGYVFNPVFDYKKGSFMGDRLSVSAYLKKQTKFPPAFRPLPALKKLIVGEKVFGQDYVPMLSDSFSFTQFSGALEYAVQGWARWNKALKITKAFHILYQMSFNLPAAQQLDGMNDKALFCYFNTENNAFYAGGGNLHLKQTNDVSNAYLPGWGGMQGILNGDWFFFYHGYSHDLTKGFYYFSFPNQDYTYATNVQQPVPGKYMGISFGAHTKATEKDNYQPWLGSIRDTYLRVGTGAYREDDFDSVKTLKDQKCAVLYSECEYSGDHIEVCENNSKMDPDFVIQSIRVPKYKKLTLYNLANFAGQGAVFTEDVRCLSSIPFANLAASGVKLIQKNEQVQHE